MFCLIYLLVSIPYFIHLYNPIVAYFQFNISINLQSPPRRWAYFALIGTFNLQVQGIKIDAHDLDILTDNDGLNKFAQIFESQIVKQNYYNETQLNIGKTEIHIVCSTKNPFRPNDFKKEIVIIKKEGLQILCMSLKSELDFYSRINRPKDKNKVELIKAKLNN